MSFKKRLKKAIRYLIGDLSGIQWRDLDHKKVYGAIAAVIAVIVLIIVLIVSAVTGDKKLEDEQNPAASVEEVPATEAEEVPEDPLEVNAYEAVNELVQRYFQGLSSGDTELVASTVDVLTEEEKQTIERKKDYIEAYHDVTCYTKNGLEEGAYVVFAAYEMKIYNIETPAPGIMALYVCEAEDGSLYIFNGEAPEELTNYVLELAAEEEVAAVIADVDARYQQLVAEDEDLGKFAETMLQSQQEAPAEEEPEAPVEGESAKELEEPVETTVNDGIRIRAERSTDSRTLATITSGTSVKVYASYEDGWSKIETGGHVGYCKTEFLESTEGVPMLSEGNTSEEAEETTTEEPAAESDTTAVNKKMKLTDAVRMRSERSTDSNVKKMIYENEIVTVIESYSDGWSKIEQNDVTGYCKTEYLAEVD